MSMIETVEEPTWADDLQFEAADVAPRPSGLRRRLKWIGAAVAAVAVVTAAALWFLHPFSAAATPLVTGTATTGTIVSSVSLSGSVASSVVKELDFGASGSVTAVNVAVGDQVTAGEVLATIDGSALAVQLQAAQANLAAAQAKLATDTGGPTADVIASAQDAVNQANFQLTTARQSLSDTTAKNNLAISQAEASLAAAQAQLAADEAASAPAATITKDEQAISSAQAALASTELNATLSLHQAQNAVTSASLNLTNAQHNYAAKIAPATSAQITADQAAVAQAKQALTTLQQEGTTITSPIAGTVTAVNLTVGQQVSGNAAGSGSSSSSSSSSSTTGQIEVMDLTKLQIAGEASETDIAKLKLNQSATVTASALGTDTVVGHVCSLSVVGTSISGVTSYGVTVCLDTPNSTLRIGMSATAAVVTDRADNAVIVPTLAVRTVAGQQVVTVLAADGKTESTVPVTVGITNGSQVQILSGLSDGQTVVETVQSTTTNRAGGGGLGGGARIFGGLGG